MKRQDTKWKNIFSIHITDNVLVFEIYKLHMTIPKKNSRRKMGRRYEQSFHRRGNLSVKRHEKMLSLITNQGDAN